MTSLYWERVEEHFNKLIPRLKNEEEYVDLQEYWGHIKPPAAQGQMISFTRRIVSVIEEGNDEEGNDEKINNAIMNAKSFIHGKKKRRGRKKKKRRGSRK